MIKRHLFRVLAVALPYLLLALAAGFIVGVVFLVEK
jgi:hypothetical protein